MRISTFARFAILMFFVAAWAAAQSPDQPCPFAQPVPQQLKIPAHLPPGEPIEFERQLLAYFSTLEYRKLGWCMDKWVRDTGPLMNGAAIFVHPPVRIYYSPEVSRWLLGGRQGVIPDGAVIIKEQFNPAPAARYWNTPDDQLGCSNDWTFMIKNSAASKDGWFWGEVWNSQSSPMNFNDPFQYPNTGFGLYCVRCHASAEKESTFSTLNNIKNAPGWPLTYRVDDTWMSVAAKMPGKCGGGPSGADALALGEYPTHAQNAALESRVVPHVQLTSLPPPEAHIQSFPPEPLDKVVSSSGGPSQFLTSDQCLGCHSGYGPGGFGPSMAIKGNSAFINVSPYGEWRWSPMGLAGRDPVFYSQLDSELAFLDGNPQKQQMVVNTCMQCHGGMGKRQYATDHPTQDFKVDFVYETDPSKEGFKYGGLARDGISCLLCHHMAPPKDPSLSYFLANKINGNFDLTPPNELNGPFVDDQITTFPMDQGLGLKPKFNAYIKDSQMCGACHTILLPVVDSPDPNKKSVEQDTYVEWLNSDFRNEYESVGPNPKSCQDCHMPGGYVNTPSNINVKQIQTRFANVQDITYPATEHLGTPQQLNVRYRKEGFVRHEFLGANGFLLQMFNENANSEGNNTILGVRLKDYMSGLTTDLPTAIDNVVQQVQYSTAGILISKMDFANGKLIVEATVSNFTGHRFPSGVGFRRAFLTVTAHQNGKLFFESGQTDPKGQIVNWDNKVLATEYFTNKQYQPHFDQTHPITDSNQVQIYEELEQDAKGNFTTSFTRRDHTIKDNRLLPSGWRFNGPANLKIPEPFLAATHPEGGAASDPVYLKGEGQSIVRYEIPLPAGANASNVTVKAALWSQSTPPYFLADRYQTATPATARLKYLVDQMGTLENTDFANWKVLVCSTQK
jgi:hypothetical protein